MTLTKKDLAGRIIELTRQRWKDSRKPLLLSQLGPVLKASGLDYAAIPDWPGLKSFVSNEVSDLQIVTHPTQHAKIGVYPAAENFEFPDAQASVTSEPSEAEKLRKNRRAFYAFIEAVSELPPEEIDGFDIPARVIVWLLQGK